MGQPGSILLNHLGLTTTWNISATSHLNTFKLSHSLFILKKFLKLILSVSLVYNNHLFFNSFFFNYYLRYLSLPVNITDDTFFKFYRIQTLTNSILNIKKNYIVRISLKKFHISNIFFLSINDWFILYFYIYTSWKKKKNRISSKIFNTSILSDVIYFYNSYYIYLFKYFNKF